MNVSINAYNMGDINKGFYKPYSYFKKSGWKNLSYTCVDEEFDSLVSDKWLDYVKSIKENYDENGFNCVQAHMVYYNLLLDPAKIIPETEKFIERSIIAASIMGAKWTVYHPRTSLKGKDDIEGSHKINKEILLRLLDVAHKYNIGIAAENMPLFRDVPWRNLFGDNYLDMLNLVEDINNPLLGYCYDFGHAHMAGVDHAEAIRKIGSKLKATHIHSNMQRNHDSHFCPSVGTIDWDSVIDALAEINYDNSLSIEVVYPKELFAETYFRHNRECVEIIMNKVEEKKKINK